MMKSKILLVVSYIAVGLFILSGCMKNEESDSTKQLRSAYQARIAAKTAAEAAQTAILIAQEAQIRLDMTLQEARIEAQKLDNEIKKGSSQLEIDAAKARYQAQIDQAIKDSEEANLAAAVAINSRYAAELEYFSKWRPEALNYAKFQDLYEKLFGGGLVPVGYYTQRNTLLGTLATAYQTLINFETADASEYVKVKKFLASEAEQEYLYAVEMLLTYETYLNDADPSSVLSLKQAREGIQKSLDRVKSEVSKVKASIADNNAAIKQILLDKRNLKLQEKGLDAGNYTTKVDVENGQLDGWYLPSGAPGALADMYPIEKFTVNHPFVGVAENDYSKVITGKQTVTGLDAAAQGYKPVIKTNPIPAIDRGEAGPVVEIEGISGKVRTIASAGAITKAIEEINAEIRANDIYVETEVKPLLKPKDDKFRADYVAFNAAARAYNTDYANALKATTNAKNINVANEAVRKPTIVDNLEALYNGTLEAVDPAAPLGGGTYPAATVFTRIDTAALQNALGSFFYEHYKLDHNDGINGGYPNPTGKEVADRYSIFAIESGGTWKFCETEGDFQEYFKRQDKYLLPSSSATSGYIAKVMNTPGSIDAAGNVIKGINRKALNLRYFISSAFTYVGYPGYPGSGYNSYDFASAIDDNSDFEITVDASTNYYKFSGSGVTTSFGGSDTYKTSLLGKFLNLARETYGASKMSDLWYILGVPGQTATTNWQSIFGTDQLDATTDEAAIAYARYNYYDPAFLPALVPRTKPVEPNAAISSVLEFRSWTTSSLCELAKAHIAYDEGIKVSDEFKKKNTDLKALITIYAGVSASVAAELKPYKDALDLVNKDIEAINKEIDALYYGDATTKGVIDYQFEINKLSKEVEDLNATLAILKDNNDSDYAIVDDLVNGPNGLKNSIDGLHDAWKRAVAQVTLVDDNKYKEYIVKQYEANIAKIQSQIGSLNALIAEIEAEMKDLYDSTEEEGDEE